jgi:two-component system sensor histidine kinase KdpD
MAEMARVVAQHRIALDAPADTPPAMLHPVLGRQVFLNLIDNAAKYAPAGSRIDIVVRSAGGTVAAEIADEGPGIPAEHLDSVFDRFVRVQGGDRRRAGTGLGLAICRGLVEAMGGNIAVRNRTGRSGAVFTVTFPVATVPALRHMEDALGDAGPANSDRR